MTAAAGAPSLEGLSLDKLDVISPAHYEVNGYPHAEWTYLRKHAPVHRFTGDAFDPFYAIVKHADIVEIGKNPSDFIIEPRLAVFTRDIPPDQVKLRHLLTMDPPEHRTYRAVTAKQFTPRMTQHWAPKVERITSRILDEASEKGACDFVQDVAAPITIAVIAEMLGVSGDDWKLLFKWTNEAIAPEDPEFQQGRTTEETMMSARTELFQYFSDLSQERRVRPKDDIVSVVGAGKVDGKLLEPFELMSYYLLLVVAGNETTRNAMTGGMLAFYDNRDEWRRLVANPGLIDSAVEEIVRWTTPVIQFTREATRDVVVRGTKIAKGESVCLFYASGNRDEEIFDEPFRFRIDREPNDHIGFGRGEHVCLGAHLARLELRTVFDQIRARLESFDRTGKEERVRSSFVGGIKRAPITWKLGPAKG